MSEVPLYEGVLGAAVERIWCIYDSQGQIMAWAFRPKSLKQSEAFPLCSEAVAILNLKNNYSAEM